MMFLLNLVAISMSSVIQADGVIQAEGRKVGCNIFASAQVNQIHLTSRRARNAVWRTSYMGDNSMSTSCFVIHSPRCPCKLFYKGKTELFLLLAISVCGLVNRVIFNKRWVESEINSQRRKLLHSYVPINS